MSDPNPTHSRPRATRRAETRFRAFEPPPLEALQAVVALQKRWFDPRAFGLERIQPGRPALLVGNHTLYGALDFPLILEAIYRERGVFVRSLADRFHFAVPYWRDFIERFGIVEGSRTNCAALMDAGQHVLVYPGGAREVCKRRGEQYALTWKQRTGFVYMAIEHGYDIIPFASIGADNAYSILLDAGDIQRTPLGSLLRRVGVSETILRQGDLIPPIARGIGLTALPRPERFYFGFCKPIRTAHLRGKEHDIDLIWQLRRRVEKAITGEIQRLLLVREQDTEPQGILRRVLRSL